MLTLNKESTPAAPGASKGRIFLDTADMRVKVKLDDGSIVVVSPFNQPDNLVINGGFLFAQRQLPGTLTTYSQTASRVYGADRVGMTNENASIQYQRVDSIAAPEVGLLSRYYGKFKKITSLGKIFLSQAIEGSNMAPLRGRAVRVQAKMKYSIAASMTARLGLMQLQSTGVVDTIPGYAAGTPSGSFVTAFSGNGTDPTFGANLTLLTPRQPESTGTVSGNGLSCVLGTAWTRYSAVFDVPLTCKNLIPVIFSHNQLTANDEINVAEWGLYDGEQVMDWSHDVVPIEYAKVLRYFTKTFGMDFAPAQNTGAFTGEARGIAGKAGAVVNAGIIHWRYPVPLRAGTPGITAFNPGAANALMRNITGVADMGATAQIASSGDSGLTMTSSGVVATAVGDSIGSHFTSDNEL